MIEVPEEAALNGSATDTEIYDLLSRYYGRVLRLKTVEDLRFSPREIKERYGLTRERTESITIGRLNRLSFLQRDREHYSHEGSTFTRIGLAMSSEEPITLEPAYSTIEVLQEDTGTWKLIHRGSGWQELNPTESKELETP